MKKLFLSLIIILLLSVVFTSCAIADPGQTPAPEESTPIPESSPTLESTPIDDDTACTVVFSFKSIEDFELYCKTGSKDASLYKKPPSLFPAFEMKEGIFVEPNELFPDLDVQGLTVDYIEIVSPYEYSYSGKTNDGTVFGITISYDENASEVSADKIIEKRSLKANINIVKGDYYTSKVKLGALEDKHAVYNFYIFDMDDCTLEYHANVRGNVVTSMWIHHGNYAIGISSFFDSNLDAFFADEVLKPMTDLFSGGEARIEALNKIKEYIESKK